MPMYFFHLYDHDAIYDSEGIDLLNVAAAREHASGVARELTRNSSGFLDHAWSGWTISVQDQNGLELFTLPMSAFDDGTS
jgi:hypothetical protein